MIVQELEYTNTYVKNTWILNNLDLQPNWGLGVGLGWGVFGFGWGWMALVAELRLNIFIPKV